MSAKIFLGMLFLAQCLLGLPQKAVAQQSGKIVIVHPAVGETITRDERDQYGLFPEIKGFQAAVFWQMPDSTYRIRITYFENGIKRILTKVLSREEVMRNYHDRIERMAALKDSGKPAGPEVSLHTKQGDIFTGRLIGMENDSVQCYLPEKEVQKVDIGDLETLTLVHHPSWKKMIYLSFAAAGIAGIIGLASGDDPPGWFSMTAEEKALVASVSTFTLGLVSSAFYNSIKAVDVKVPLNEQSLELKRLLVKRVIKGTYRAPKTLAASCYGSVLHIPEEGFMPGFEGRLSYSPKPLASIDFVYGKTSWKEEKSYTRVVQDDIYAFEKDLVKPKTQWYYWGFNVTLSSPRSVKYLPFLSWGFVLMNRSTVEHITTTRITHNYLLTGEDKEDRSEYQISSKEIWAMLNLSAGVQISLSRYIHLETSLNVLFGLPSYPMIKLGIQLRLPEEG